jgi:hypothetical protein
MKNILSIALFITATWVYGQAITPAIMNKIEAVAFRPDPNNEDGIFIARNKRSNKWGMYQAWSEQDIQEIIPPAYDSIDFFDFNGMFTGVWNNHKVGIYLSRWTFDESARQSVGCRYDAYKVYTIENRRYPYLAVQKDGKWAWVDWLSGKERSLFYEELVYPSFEQTLDAEYPIVELPKDFPGFEHLKKKQDSLSQLWGLADQDDAVLIPLRYDSLHYFNEDGELAGVFLNGKVGLYTSPWIFGDQARQTTACIYDDYKLFQVFKPINTQTHKAVTYVAVKMGDYWYWINWLTGELKREEGMYNLDMEDMPYPEFDQDY